MALEDEGPSLCQPPIGSYTELASTHYDLAVLYTSFWVGGWGGGMLAYNVVCICVEMSLIFLFKRQPQIHALFSWENTSKEKTIAWVFYVGVGAVGCNETSFFFFF